MVGYRERLSVFTLFLVVVGLFFVFLYAFPSVHAPTTFSQEFVDAARAGVVR